MQLIPRLYDVTGGEVLVDGVNVKEYSLNTFVRVSAWSFRKMSFSGTIEENLRWGNEDAPMDVIRFSESAQADPFVKTFKNGWYDTEMGQGGVNVSGGQKQSLCIA